MSIDRETNSVPAFVSFRGQAMPSGAVATAANVMASNRVASNIAASNIMVPGTMLSAALRDTHVSRKSHRDLCPPSSPLDTR